MIISITKDTALQEIENSILRKENSTFQFSQVEHYDQSLINTLQKRYENLVIRGIKWNGTITINNGIATKDIMKHKLEFLNLFKEITITGEFLLNKLFEINKINRNDDEIGNLIGSLKSSNKYPLTEINKEWNCRIHGLDFAFEHQVSKQLIEVSMQDSKKLNPWGINIYLRNSSKFNNLKILVEGKEDNIRKSMDVLHLNGYLEPANDRLNNNLRLKKDYL